MGQTDNNILVCVTLLERSLALLKENTRETVKKHIVVQIGTNLDSILCKLVPRCSEAMVLSPIMEVTELIKLVLKDDSFVETDNETKIIMVERLKSSLSALYLFAGKFYMENEFSYSMGTADIVKRVVDGCIAKGFYFGIDTELRQNGEID